MIKNHKFRGTNDSLYYKYVLNPFCTYLVDHVIPEWLAPNVITLIGLIINAAPCVYLVYEYGFSFDGEISGFACILHGVTYQIYIILDNCDGK